MKKDPDAPMKIDNHHEFALVQYHKSLKNLRDAITAPDNVECPRVALIACFVLASFDMLYGHTSFAVRHGS
jgi:hypothetical protein